MSTFRTMKTQTGSVMLADIHSTNVFWDCSVDYVLIPVRKETKYAGKQQVGVIKCKFCMQFGHR